MQLPVPPIDLSQVPAWLISSTTLVGILTIIVLPLIKALFSRVGWLKQLGDLGVYFIVGLIGLILYWLATFIGAHLTPELTAQLQPYWTGVPVIMVIVIGMWAVRNGVRGVKTVYGDWRGTRSMKVQGASRVVNWESPQTANETRTRAAELPNG